MVPQSPAEITRPTLDRAREALFNILQNQIDQAHFLDLFAGTGTIGIEGLSRGGASVTFVEKREIPLIKRNLKLLPEEAQRRTTVLEGGAVSVCSRLIEGGKKFDIIFADPPWRGGHEKAILDQSAQLLTPDGVLIVEMAKGDNPPAPPLSLYCYDSRRYGDTCFHFYHLADLV
jgi:16S rRNA (guanine(966)-N(2))-methyltransferase RsmD